jgi:SSS family solute:Na+ symporter
LKFDENFSKVDKLTAGGIFWWSIVLVAINLTICTWHFVVHPWPVAWWAHYWMITGIALPCVIAVGTLIWFGIGGVRDIRDFFVALRTMKRDVHDDGRVEKTSDASRAFPVTDTPPPTPPEEKKAVAPAT